MLFIIIGSCAVIVGLITFRRGKKSGSHETMFGSLGLIFGGLMLILAFVLLLFTKQI